MPAKNTIREYVEGGVYHVYNRGIDKRIIFPDNQDYRFFLYLLKASLLSRSDLDRLDSRFETDIARPRRKNFSDDIEFLGYCLMPNHLHLIIRQIGENGLSEFMQTLITSYVLYFNKKYKRTGALFQGRFRAVLVTEDEYLMQLSRYIHCNPLKLFNDRNSFLSLETYSYSSYADYLGKRETEWIKTDFILNMLSNSDVIKSEDRFRYKNFVNSYKEESAKAVLGNFTLED